MPWQKPRAEPAQQTAERGFFDRLLPTQEGVDFLAESAGALAQGVGDFARDQAGITGTHYRNLANLPYSPLGEDMLGLVDRPTPEAQSEYKRQVVEGALTAGTAGIAGGLSKGAQALGRAVMRGGPKSTTARWLADNARHMVPEGAQATANVAIELARPVAVGVGTERLVNWSDPATSDFWDSLISIPAGLAAAGVSSQQGRANLLLQHPAFREIAMKASRAGVPSKVIGGLAGYALSQLYPQEQPE